MLEQSNVHLQILWIEYLFYITVPQASDARSNRLYIKQVEIRNQTMTVCLLAEMISCCVNRSCHQAINWVLEAYHLVKYTHSMFLKHRNAVSFIVSSPGANPAKSCGQSYKHFTLVNYDSRLVIITKLLILTTLES